MTNAKIEPGNKTITPAAPSKADDAETEEKDVLPELGLKRPEKSRTHQDTTASPLDPDVDLGK